MKIRIIWAGSMLALLLAGCGGSDGVNATGSVGRFIDSAVAGVSYTTSSGGSGITDAAGNLSYQPGDTVTFSIGNLVLGSCLGQELITPADLTASSDAELNLARFLQTIDDDGNPDNGITITPVVVNEIDAMLAGGAIIDFNLDSVSFSTSADLADLLIAIDTVTSARTETLVSASAARAHLDASLAGVALSTGNVIDASGGNAGNRGGWASYYNFGIYLQKDAGYGAIEILSSGNADASFTPTVVSDPDLGLRPLTIAVDTTLAVYDMYDTPPAAGTPYIQWPEHFVYIADGDLDFTNDLYATGLSVAAGATLTMVDNVGIDTGYNGWGVLQFPDSLINRGTITVVDSSPEQRLNLFIMAENNIINLGTIETYGKLPGQNGGAVNLRTAELPESDGNIINQGPILTYGANNRDGHAGNGGEVVAECVSNGRIENTALIDTHGGTASGLSGFGGGSGTVDMRSYLGLDNSGEIRANGGDGIDGVFYKNIVGTGVGLGALYRGSVRNSGTINAYGGSAIYGNGHAGGSIGFMARGGSVINSGDIFADGGDTVDPANSGLGSGAGGTCYSYVFADIIDGSVPAGDVIFSGNADLRSGDVLSDTGLAGLAGEFYATVSNPGGGGQKISLLGYQRLDTSGGNGGNSGGNAAAILVGNEGTGPVTNEALLVAHGGDADPTQAGSKGGLGGTINLYSGGIGTTTTASLEVSGGNGETPGADGLVTIDTTVP